MKVFIKREKTGVDAKGEFNLNEGTLTVFAGSRLCERIAFSDKFRGAKTIEKTREGIVKGGVLKKDVTFKSASTAANFVTGSSTNGLTAWKTENGEKLKDLIPEKKKK